MKKPVTFLCLASYFKGEEFFRALKREDCTVYLVTAKSLEHKPWPHEAIDETFYVEEEGARGVWDLPTVTTGLAHVMRTRRVDRIVALDDFDVEKGAYLREHFRLPGMGQTTCRYFRDKLAMRVKAAAAGIAVPAFSALFHDADVHAFAQRTPGPWVIKPRGEASAAGIKKVHNADELWRTLELLGDERHHYLVEQFKPGDVFHVDSLTVGGKVVFARVSQYVNTPMEVAHGGGIFRTVTTPFGSKEDKALQKLNAELLRAFGLEYSTSHTEFIRAHADGKYYFLETASRVGGAHIAEMVEFSSGINLWAEWARLEAAMARGETYQLPAVQQKYAGLIVSLCRYERPDYAGFDDPEVVWRMNMDHHIGLICQSERRERVVEMLTGYAQRIQADYHASAPSPDKPTY